MVLYFYLPIERALSMTIIPADTGLKTPGASVGYSYGFQGA